MDRVDPFGNRLGQALVVEGDKVHKTDRYGNKLGQAYVVRDRTPARPMSRPQDTHTSLRAAKTAVQDMYASSS